ncbi:MAG: hypothetical protein JNL11_02925 [Bdellovibrionaceae bacterium]|nr:hypothetical protein [Pseudobdellovibrionaceae bacterium]
MKYKNILILIISTSALGLLFQNCQGVNFKNAASTTSPSSSLSRTQSSTSSIVDSSEASSTIESNEGIDSVALKVDHITSAVTQSDCSKPNSTITTTISNAGSDILVCPEYSLDMPAGHPRNGESAICRDKDFVKPPASWVYNHGDKKWTSSENVNNSPYLVPGSYRIAVKDNQGRIYRSGTAVVKRAGYANCLASASPSASTSSSASSAATKTKQCNWSGGIVIGPTPNYAIANNQVCQKGTETYRFVDSAGAVHNYQCICQ